MSVPYSAPGRDGTYRADPGRDHPRYKESESLMMLDELEERNNAVIDDDNPFRPVDPVNDKRVRYNQGRAATSSDMVPYSDEPPPPQNTVVGTELMAVPDDDDDSDDDLMFDEDRPGFEQRGAPDSFHDEDDNEEVEEGRREWKYSTAGIKQRGVWVKYCCILICFLVAFAIFATISHFFSKLFEDPGPPPPPDFTIRPDNSTFPANKQDVDQVCSAGRLQQDQGLACRAFCEPAYSACCDPFPRDVAYNFTNVDAALNNTPVSSEIIFTDPDFVHLNDCEVEENLRGCTSYSKCSGLQNVVEPAPQTLPFLCSDEGRERDAQSCRSACRKAQCCYHEQGQSCLAENFEICMDYAPCQNLRDEERVIFANKVLPVAPTDLDQQCLWKLPSCNEHCTNALCCTDPQSRCLQENFLACLTYSACEDSTIGWNLTIPPIYSFVDQAPAELIYGCNEEDYSDNPELIELIEPDGCPEYCEQAACCYQSHPQDNCFSKDPWGCLAWHQHCQTEPAILQSWFIGEFILPQPLKPNN